MKINKINENKWKDEKIIMKKNDHMWIIAMMGMALTRV